MIIRNQKLFVCRRKSDGKYLTSPKGEMWSADIRLAFMFSETKFTGLIRAVLGRDECDFDMVEIMPQLRE